MSTQKTELPRTLALVGAGKMGGALLQGWLELGVSPGGVSVLDPYPSAELTGLCAARGVSLNPAQGVAAPDVVVLAIKPQMLGEAAPELAPLIGPQTLVISIMAGKTIGDIAARLPASAIVRAMPNTPASVGRGITGVAANAAVTPAQRAMTDALLGAIGQVEGTRTHLFQGHRKRKTLA